MHDDLSETHILGPDTFQIVVRQNDTDQRPWLRHAPTCPALKHHRIAHAGACIAKDPYRIVRMQQSGAYFIACIGGEGRILVDGKWRVCKAGMACLLPPHMLNAFHAIPGKYWSFAWVRYEAAPNTHPILSASSPMLAPFHGLAIHNAISGLHSEAKGAATPSVIHQWLELVQTYVQQFTQPLRMDNRLYHLWNHVEPRLEKDWTVDTLAARAHLSGEHLRRLCLHQLGRPPLRHLTWLRMRRAAELLSTTDEKIETIAHLVGYQNPFVFSNTFKKWIGWRPSEHRNRT
ncbi:AraC family transcriptional regulator [Phragmitibacter flavus]|nr:AraC family transcriptional regulator [Phragmitibacter flavus]